MTTDARREAVARELLHGLDEALATRFPNDPSGRVTELLSDDVVQSIASELAETVLAWHDAETRALREATIEECARFAESIFHEHDDPECSGCRAAQAIADAIRDALLTPTRGKP